MIGLPKRRGPGMSSTHRFDWHLNSLTEQAVEAGLLSSGSRGHKITQQVVLRGLDSLSPAQRIVYLTEAVPALNEMLRRQSTSERSGDALGLAGAVLPAVAPRDASALGESVAH
jgi:hypothetical protein